ncbi:branched-chain amino acid transaminase [Sphaerisporangium aureirubrum]|uniref:Branched-chain-amino-acid aminotransferase n=1 Tax=Sphaerisporangium aureirubrum TaxID=1544736 RepID=A0ABW1NHH3_9ACTN
MSGKIWFDGEMKAWEDATVHVSTLGLHYGIGFFEGIRSHATDRGTVVFRLTDHLERLRRSAAIYGVPAPYTVDQLRQACFDVITANNLDDCYLRPIMFLGQGADPLRAPFHTAVIASQHGPLVGAPPTGGVKAKISSFHRFTANSMPPAAKATGQYLNAMLAQTEAKMAGCDEALLLNKDGFVADGWAHNVFIVRNGTVITPPTTSGALPGITRESVLTLAAERGIPAREADLVRSDLYLADECFLTGTAAGLVPVASVDGRPIGGGDRGDVTATLIKDLHDAVHGTSHQEWLEPVA